MLASTRWRGDFETGNLSQWSSVQIVANDRMQVVSAPAREGRYAVKVTVKKGDDPIDASGNRNELVYLSNEAPGSEYFYKWSTMFDASFPSPDTWQLFAQWHHDGCCGSPPIEFVARDEQLSLRIGGASGQVVWAAPLKRAIWNDFILHVKWSSDPRVGFVELYHQGKLVLAKTRGVTQYAGMGNYMKLGLYRDESISPTGIVFHDGMVMATTLEDVLPPAVPETSGVTPIEPTQSEPRVVEEQPTGLGEEVASDDTPPTVITGNVSLGCSAGEGETTPFFALLLPLALLVLARLPAAVKVKAHGWRR